MKKNKILILAACSMLIAVMSACGSYMRAALGMPEPKSSSEATTRKKITSAVDKSSKEIISNLPKGIKLAVLGGNSTSNDQEF